MTKYLLIWTLFMLAAGFAVGWAVRRRRVTKLERALRRCTRLLGDAADLIRDEIHLLEEDGEDEAIREEIADFQVLVGADPSAPARRARAA